MFISTCIAVSLIESPFAIQFSMRVGMPTAWDM